MSQISPLTDRPRKHEIVLFDVDGTLTPARLVPLPNAHLYLC
jgi:hypothetical protein